MKPINKRLATLEQAQQARAPRYNGRFTDDLMLIYGTAEDTDRPLTESEMRAALDQVYGAMPAAQRPR